MIKLLIADDEQVILEGLKVVIDWNEYGVEIVGTASNGIEALELAIRLEPDIVLTDIRMPGMTGLELIQNLSEKLPKAFCILLTGYKEFEYAQEALKYGAVRYLLKPVDEIELCEIITSIKKKLSSVHLESNKLKDYNQKFLKSASYVRNQLIFSIVNGEGTNLNEMLQMLASYGVNDLPEQYVCFVIDINLEQENNTFNLGDRELVKFAVANIVEEVLKSKTGGNAFYTSETKVIGLMQITHYEIDRIDRVLREIMIYTKNSLKINISIGVSSLNCGYESMSKSYNEATRALKYKMLTGDIIHFGNIEQRIPTIYNVPIKIEKELINCIICGDSECIEAVIEELFKDAFIAKIDIEGFLLGIRDMMSLIRRNLEAMEYDVSMITQRLKSFFKKAELCTIDELKVGMARLLMDLTGEVSAGNIGGSKALILKIRQYIDENYSEQLTLNTISEKFFIHSSYFSRLFKKETNENFIDYLTKKRIDESKKLLIRTDMKVYEVSEKVGYSNPKYFSKLFEKYTGVSPKEYRHLKNLNVDYVNS